MQNSYRQVFGKTQNLTAPATYKKGIIAQINRESATADVTIVGNNQTVLRSLPVSSAINIDDIRIGDRCRVDMFDETNPNDSVIAYTYGRGRRPVYNVNSSIENIGINQSRLDVTGSGVFFNGKTLAEAINSGEKVLDPSKLNVTGITTFFNGLTLAQEINSGLTTINQSKLNVTGTGLFANNLTLAEEINAGTKTIDGSHVAGILTLVTEIKRTNTLIQFALGGSTFFQPILAGSAVSIGSSGSRFGTVYANAFDASNFVSSGLSGVDGTFTTSGVFTITVTNGIITNIS